MNQKNVLFIDYLIRDKTLFYSIHRLNHFPINFKITKYDWRIYVKNRKENVKPQT